MGSQQGLDAIGLGVGQGAARADGAAGALVGQRVEAAVEVGGPPVADGLAGDAEDVGQVGLGEAQLAAAQARRRRTSRASSDNCRASGKERAMMPPSFERGRSAIKASVSILHAGVISTADSNTIDSNQIGTDASKSDPTLANDMSNFQIGVYLPGTPKAPVTNTRVTNNTIAFDPSVAGQADFKGVQDVGTITNKGNNFIKYPPPPAPDPNPNTPGPTVLLIDSTNATFGDNVVQGDVEQDNGNVTVSGTVSISGVYAENAGTLSLLSATVVANNVDVAVGADLSGDGTITGNVNNAGEVDTDSNAPLIITGAYTQTAGLTNVGDGDVLTIGDDFDQSGGTVNANGGTVAVAGAYNETGGTVTLESGTISTDDGVQVASGGVLSGYGTITGAVTNAGEIDVTANDALTVAGAYTQTAGVTNVNGDALLSVTGRSTSRPASSTSYPPTSTSTAATRSSPRPSSTPPA